MVLPDLVKCIKIQITQRLEEPVGPWGLDIIHLPSFFLVLKFELILPFSCLLLGTVFNASPRMETQG